MEQANKATYLGRLGFGKEANSNAGKVLRCSKKVLHARKV
jgi:hypothetical protein